MISESEKMPKVSVILTVKNQQRTIAHAIETLLAIDYPDYEVIIVDGGSEDQTFVIAQNYSVKTVQKHDSSPGQGRNRGIAYCSSSIVAFIDGDCYVEGVTWLRDGVHLLELTNVGGVAGPMIPFNKAPYMSRALLNILSTFFANAGTAQFARYREQREVKNIHTCNAVYRREAIERAGLFANDLRFCEDADLNFKIRKLGYRLVYSPKIMVQHDWKVSSFASLFRYMFAYGAGRSFAAKKYPHLFSPVYAVPSFMLALALSIFILSFIFLGIFNYIAWFLVSSYFVLAFSAAFLAAHQFKDAKMVLIAPIAYVLVHIGYGLGFMRGLVDRKAR